MLKIPSGLLKGMKLQTPEGDAVTRPTSARLREAVLDILRDQIEGSRVLDLCAGSGSMGLSFASNGASEVVFVEKNQKVLAHLKANKDLAQERLRKQGANVQIEVIRTDMAKFLTQGRMFDLVWVDPPYQATIQLLTQNMPLLVENLSAEGFLVIEHSKNDTVKIETILAEEFVIEKVKTYGDSNVIFARVRSDKS